MASEYLPVSRQTQQEPEQEGGLQLDRLRSVLKKHVLLIAGVTTLLASAAVAKSLTETSVYSAEFELLTPPETLETQIISTISPDTISNQPEAVGVGSLDDTKLKILTSPRVLEPAVEELQRVYPDINYRALTNNLNLKPSKDGETLTVGFKNSDPKKVNAVLDIMSATFLRYSLEDRQNDIYRGIDFVDEQLPIVKDRVTQLEAELESLRQNSNLIDPLLQGEQLSQQMAKFTSEQLDLKVQLEQSEKLYDDLELSLDRSGELASTSALLQSDRYQSLLNQLLEVDSQLAEDLTLYLGDSPEIAVVEERRENLRPLLERESLRVQEQVSSYIRELRARDEALENSIATLDGRIQSLSTVARQYNSIQRDLDIAANNLSQFLTKREALRIDAAQRQTPWEVLTPHGSPRASSSSLQGNLVLGSLLGLLLGTGVAILLDRISNKIYTVRELKDAANLPLLGTIPYNHSIEEGYSLVLPKHQSADPALAFEKYDFKKEQSARPFLEAFRLLATNVNLNSLDGQLKSLAISSAIPSEGKSSVAYYLAHAYAALGKRTLLIDTDLRHPTLHKLCSVSNERGLSNYLAGEVLLNEALLRLPTDDDLFFLPAGPILSDPVKVLASKKIEDLQKQIYKTFDMVIFDTPPLLGFADAFMVIRNTQGLLLTSRLGHLNFSQLQSALDELYVAKIQTLGIVANASRQEDNKAYSYQHYYAQANSQLEQEEMMHVNGNSNGRVSWKNPLSGILNKR